MRTELKEEKWGKLKVHGGTRVVFKEFNVKVLRIDNSWNWKNRKKVLKGMGLKRKILRGGDSTEEFWDRYKLMINIIQ